MNAEQLEDALRASLHDYQLSRGEKSAIRQMIDDGQLTPHDLSVCRNAAFKLASEAIDAVRIPQVLEWLEDVTKVLHKPAKQNESDADEAWFSPGEGCVQRIRSLLNQSKTSIDICIFTITDDRIAASILEAFRRGVAVRIITDNDKSYDPGSDASRLAEAGIPLRIDQTQYHMHHKFAIFDGSILLNGSYNWTRSAADQNEENIIVTSSRKLILEFSKVFESLWSSFQASQQ